jgi:hypothetical protein
MRRRALLAASSGKTGDLPSFNFPIYLEWDYCDTSPWFGYCERAADELTISLYDYLFSILEIEGINEGAGPYISSDNLERLGIEIYIDNEKVDRVAIEALVRGYYIFVETPSNPFIRLEENGYLYDGD